MTSSDCCGANLEVATGGLTLEHVEDINTSPPEKRPRLPRNHMGLTIKRSYRHLKAGSLGDP